MSDSIIAEETGKSAGSFWPAAWQAASSRFSALADCCRRLADAARVAEFVRIPAAVGWALPTIRATLDTRAPHRRRGKSLQEMLFSRRIFEVLEARAMLSIYAYDVGYTAVNTQTLNVAAPGVLTNDVDTGGYRKSEGRRRKAGRCLPKGGQGRGPSKSCANCRAASV